MKLVETVLPRKISRLLRVNCVYRNRNKQRMPGWPRLYIYRRERGDKEEGQNPITVSILLLNDPSIDARPIVICKF